MNAPEGLCLEVAQREIDRTMAALADAVAPRLRVGAAAIRGDSRVDLRLKERFVARFGVEADPPTQARRTCLSD